MGQTEILMYVSIEAFHKTVLGGSFHADVCSDVYFSDTFVFFT